MIWHVIARVGADTFEPQIAADEGRVWAQLDLPGNKFSVGNHLFRDFTDVTGRRPLSQALDLVNLAVAAFIGDLRSPRDYSDDRWTREFRVYLPVAQPAEWQALAPHVERLLGFLTSDRWTLVLRQLTANPFIAPVPVGDEVDVVSLFSGGLDSFVGAADLLAAGRRAALVGQYGGGVAHKYQMSALNALRAEYGEDSNYWGFNVRPRLMEKKAPGEPTMRCRSILFLALGVAVASAYGPSVPLVVAENGLISLNVPLLPSRMASHSTRTTHPHFVDGFRQLLAGLGIQNQIQLPYMLKTKGEMLRESPAQQVLAAGTPHTMSCSHPESGRHRGHPPGLHCGYCVPCIIRRAATTAAGMPDTNYRVDITSNPPGAASDPGRDLRAFEVGIERFFESPTRDSLRVLESGPLPPEQMADLRAVYRRGMEEVASFLGISASAGAAP